MKILITGASSQVGDFLIPRLIQSNHSCYLVGRTPPRFKEDLVWIKADLKDEMDFFDQLGKLDVWIHIAPLYLANPWLERAAKSGIRQFIGFGTTSIFTKQNSSDPGECRFIAEILETEERIMQLCEGSDISWTVLRPTLIYGCGRDQNVSFIQQMIRLFGFFPVVGDARGLRQPVHAEDLADACAASIDNSQAANKVFNLSGGETLTYYEMVERIFLSENKAPRILRVPVPILKFVVQILSLLPTWKHLTPDMVDRINQDMVFDHTDAARYLDYSPRNFLR